MLIQYFSSVINKMLMNEICLFKRSKHVIFIFSVVIISISTIVCKTTMLVTHNAYPVRFKRN